MRRTPLQLLLPFLFLHIATAAVDDSLDVKIGQMLMVGFRGIGAAEGTSIARDLRDLHLGGVILFDFDVETRKYGRNIVSPKQVAMLTAELRSHAAAPLLIAVDQEGGLVARFKQKAGFPANVSAKYLGAMDNVDSTTYYADLMARSLAIAGVNVNFAPVLDLDVNPENPVIGKLGRSFSANPDIVVRHGSIVLEQLRDKGILGAIKHFPGHGSSRDDSHLGVVDVTGTWTRRELQPFQRIVRAGQTDMVMTAHIFNAALDSIYPATMSARTIDGVLRKELGFDGVVISDDMNMKAIVDNYGLETAMREAVNAGVDILLFGNNSFTFVPDLPRKAHATLKKLVLSGKVSRARIDTSWNRIQAMKARLKTR